MSEKEYVQTTLGLQERNPKQQGTCFQDCRPQVGKCPIGCNECFYNREGAFYSDINQPYIPLPEAVGNDLVRLNCGHDSNIQREVVIETALKYKRFFFNTSLPRLDFPGPVVFTANGKEEERAWAPYSIGGCKVKKMPTDQEQYYDNLMFVRLRTSPTNLEFVSDAVTEWSCAGITSVLTFMAYYDQDPPGTRRVGDQCMWIIPDPIGQEPSPNAKEIVAYTWKVRHINSYFCPTKEFMLWVLQYMKIVGGKLCTMCSTPDSYYCKDCRNCETYYIQAMKHLAEKPPVMPV